MLRGNLFASGNMSQDEGRAFIVRVALFLAALSARYDRVSSYADGSYGPDMTYMALHDEGSCLKPRFLALEIHGRRDGVTVISGRDVLAGRQLAVDGERVRKPTSQVSTTRRRALAPHGAAGVLEYIVE